MEKPILFSGEMVKAILDGRKTMTRRVIKPQPDHRHCRLDFEQGVLKQSSQVGGCWHVGRVFKLKYQVGDILWVQESFLVAECNSESVSVHYMSDYNWNHGLIVPDSHKDMPTGKPSKKWYSGRFMPKWASRIKLEVTNIRAERLQDMNRADAFLEGCPKEIAGEHGDIFQAHLWFKFLWDSLNFKRGFGWEVNPWVFVYEFKVRK